MIKKLQTWYLVPASIFLGSALHGGVIEILSILAMGTIIGCQIYQYMKSKIIPAL